MGKIIRITNYIFERKQVSDVQGLAQYLGTLSAQELSIVEEEFETLLPILKKQRAWKEKQKKPF